MRIIRHFSGSVWFLLWVVVGQLLLSPCHAMRIYGPKKQTPEPTEPPVVTAPPKPMLRKAPSHVHDQRGHGTEGGEGSWLGKKKVVVPDDEPST